MRPAEGRRSGVAPALLGVVALAVALRLPHLVDRSVWYDEASSWQTASFDPADLIHGVRLNVHMPLYYLLLKGWFACFGDSVVALRGFSIALGAATVALIGRFGRAVYLASRVVDESDWDPAAEARNARHLGLSVALLVACAPFEVLASIEARMYTLGSALAAACAWQVVGLLASRGEGRGWWPFGLACLALAYSHHYGLLTVASAFGVVFGAALVARRHGSDAEALRLLGRGVVTALVVGVLYLPGLGILRGQVGRVQQDYWIQPLDWDVVGRTFAEFFYPLPEGSEPRPVGWAVLGLFAACCGVAAWRARAGEGVALGLAVGPVAASTLLSSWTPVWVARYFRIAYPEMLAVVVLAAFRLTIRRPRARLAMVLGLAGALAWANVPFWRSMDLPNNPGPRGVALRVLEESSPGELVVVQEMHQYFAQKYYLRRSGRTLKFLRPALEPFWGPHLIRPADLIAPEDVPAAAAASAGGRFWVLGNTRDPVGLDLPAGSVVIGRADSTSYMHLHRHLHATHFAAPIRRAGSQPEGLR